MKKLTIEALLRWAFCDELPKGKPVAASPHDAVRPSTRAFSSTRSAPSNSGDSLGFVYGEPHPDAQRVADAVAALKPVCLGEGRIIDMLGEFVHRDETGGYFVIDDLAVRAVAGAVFAPAALVIRCAVLGEPMRWDVGRPKLKPVMAATDGRPRVAMFGFIGGNLVLLDPDRVSRRYDLERIPRAQVTWNDPTVGVVAEARAEFTVYLDALVTLSNVLRGALRDYDVMPPLIVAEPWRAGVTALPVGRVLRGAGVVPSSPLLLAPKRAPAARPFESAPEREDRESRASRRGRKARKRLDAAGDNVKIHPFNEGL